MRHGNHNRKFGRVTGQRVALLRSLARALLLNGKIVTTESRAKEIRPYVEKLVTRGKNPTVANRRLLASRLYGDEALVRKIALIAGKYIDRAGGYLRVVKLGQRKSDGSPMAAIQFVE